MKHIFLLLIAFTLFFNCFSQNQKYNINYYSAREYGKGLEATNRACVQDKNGVLYFGNAGTIIQYDGTNWNYIPVKQQNSWIFSLAVSNDNIIYVGAQYEFGYLAPDVSGKLKYVSLSDKLDLSQKIFSKIIRVLTWKNTVAFQAEEAIYIYSNNKLTTILPETSFHLSFLINNELYVRQREIGLMKLINNNFQLVNGTEFCKNFGVFSILENSDKTKFVFITREDGFWLFDTKTMSKTQILSADSNYLKLSEIYGAIRLSDGTIALNTLNNGVIITNDQFKILSVVNKDEGLKDNSVLDLIQDYQGNLWAGLNNGIAQIQYSLPTSIYVNEDGISGNITSIKSYKSKIFIGSTNGLYIQSDEINEKIKTFTLFQNFTKGIKSMCNTPDNLIIGTQDGLYKINNNSINKIEDVEVNSVYYSDNLKILFVATKKGLILYNNVENLKKLTEIFDVTEEISRFEEEIIPNGSNIWMGTQLNGIIRLKYINKTNYKIDKYNSSEDGLIDNAWALPFKINNKVVFSQRNNLLQFIDEETMTKGLADSLKNNPKIYRGMFDFYNIDSLKERLNIPFYLIEDTKNKIYVNLDGDVGYFDKTNLLSWVTKPFCLADIGKANVFFHEDNDVCWIGGDDGLLKFDENKTKNYSINFKTIFTKITCGSNDSLLYSGYSCYKSKINDFIIDFDFNTMSFSFAAPFFEGADKILYSYILVGQDTSYSQWNSENHVVFTNLFEGSYIFKIKAKNAYGHISPESTFKFSILSPWYRKVWAYFIYIIFIVILIYAGIRFNSRRLIAKNKRLEKIILERTHEIHEKNIELQNQKEEILDSINYARRIQKAVLPDDELTLNGIGEHFIILKPKDIVSGDFYWTAKIITNNNEHLRIFTVADCTGHGVPGAFMSMLCISLLNEVVLKEGIVRPDEILNKVRELIIQSLKQKGIFGEQKDGMDICLCVFNNNTKELQYSGANNPLYVVRNKNKEQIICDKQLENNDLILYEIKGDGMPIAIYEKMNPFTLHTIKMLDDDRIYLFSDGFADQFGGPKGKKFMYKTFKILLIETQSSDMENQKILLDKHIEDWKAFINPLNNIAYEQIDDICVMGVKV